MGISDEKVNLKLLNPVMSSTTYAIALSATTDSGNYKIQQVVTVRLNVTKAAREFSPEHIRTFVIDGTRKSSLIADVLYLGFRLGEGDYKYALDSNSEDDVLKLFAVNEITGQVVCSQDILLLNDTVAKEYSFNITAENSPKVTVAFVNVLVLRDVFEVNVDEGFTGIFMQYVTDTDTFKISPEGVPDDITRLDDGSFQLTKARNYEEPDERKSDIRIAVKTDDMSIQTRIQVVLNVNDLNDEAPSFQDTQISSFILAGSLSGTVIAVAECTDRDTVGTISYSLGGNYADKFDVDSSGVVTALDELKRSYYGDLFNLNVVATDGRNPSINTAMITVSLIQIDSGAKELNKTFYADVVEQQPGGLEVTNVLTANYTNYRFAVKQAENYFTLNSTTGVVKTTVPLDREDPPDVLKFLDIRVSHDEEDQCVPVKLGRLWITLQDINDNDPKFAETVYQGSLKEGSASGTSVSGLANLRATDADTGSNAELSFSLSGDASNIFEAVTVNNQVSIRVKENSTDRETFPYFNLTLTARDNPLENNTPRTGATIITIKIIDINDNNPGFENPVTELFILENEFDKVKTVATVTATDADEGLNADIMYHIQEGGLGYFRINSEGEIYQTQPVDREKYARFDLTVSATDKGSPPLQATIKMTVYVNDTNDNDPVFDTSLSHFERSEEQDCSLLNITITAYDPDEGENGTVKYSVNSTAFNINSDTGVITCTTPLDYETDKVFDVLVIATDTGPEPRSSNMTVQIRVSDINDNDPVFSKPFYNASLSWREWETDKLLLAVSVSDEDSGDNANISLTLNFYNDVFIISSGNIGVLRIKGGSNSSEASYSFNVTATDHGQPSKNSTTSIQILVVGSSEDSPVSFRSRNFSFPIEENRNYSGDIIGQVQARVVQGHEVNYSFVGETYDGFKLDPSSGNLSCNTAMDREDKATHQIVVIARESSGKGYDLALVTVTVSDVNDNYPQFQLSSAQLLFQPFEDIPSNTSIVTVRANDFDEGNNGNAGLVYSIINSDPQTPFAIDPLTAEIKTNGTLDRETVHTYNLHVQVTDGGTPRRTTTTTVKVQLKDVNDNDPMFNRTTYTKQIEENAAPGTKLDDPYVFATDPYVFATDPDYEDNGTVTYFLNSSDTCPFHVTKYENVTINEVFGEVTVNRTLDFETTSLYVCNVYAVDMALCKDSECQQQRTGTATLTVSILDNNDNAPVFHGTHYNANVSRDEEVGTVVTDAVHATDADSGRNGMITYSISSPVTEYFLINSTSGEITVNKSLVSLDQDSIILKVEATDNPPHDPALSSTVNIFINITDDNIRPWFSKKTYTASITEELLNTAFSVSLTAYDSKEGETITCNCTYSITASSLSKHFTINEKTGLVGQTSPVNREVTGSSISLEIRATDDGEPLKSTKASLTVRVIDINDNAPYFLNESHHFSVLQTSPIGSVIGQLKATDADEGDNAVSMYSSIFVDERLELHENGTITVKASLETGDETYTIRFTVLVRDSVAVVLLPDIQNTTINLAIVNITVHFKNPNEHAPEFIKAEYKSSLEFLKKKGTEIKLKDFKATDKDGHVVVYSIKDGNIRDIILINASNGSMKLNYNLDYTVGPTINLTVIAVDNAVYPRTGTCSVKITIREREPTECIREERFRGLKSDSEQKDIYLGLFAAMAGLLSIAFVATIVSCFKWRRSHNTVEYYKSLGQTYGLLDAKGKFTGSHASGYDPLQTSFSVHPYSPSQTDKVGAVNPAYIRGASFPRERAPGLPPRDTEPPPDYDDDDDDDIAPSRRRSMQDRSSRPIVFVPSMRGNSKKYHSSFTELI